MVPNPSQSSSRADYHLEQKRRSYENLDDAPAHAIPDDAELRQRAKRRVRWEDELIWAHYRDPETDLTQVEARDRAQRVGYPSEYQIVQSSVSRLVGELDDRILTEPIEQLNVRDPGGADHDLGLLPGLVVEQFGPRYGAELLDDLRESLARFLVDRDALESFARSGEVTKCWLDRDELERLEEAAVHEDWEREIVIQLMARYALRASEVLYPGNAELQHSDDADGWMPDRVEDCERAANAPFFPSVGRWFWSAAD